MTNTITQLNTQLYDLENYQDNNGNYIDFNVFFTKEKEDTHLTQLIVQAKINEEVAGYICLAYLSQDNKEKYFHTPWDFYYNQKMSTSLKDLFSHDWSAFCQQIKKSFDVEIQNREHFQSFASQLVEPEYKKFISYHLNKPYPELVTVYSDDDKYCKDFSEFPFLNIKRQPINFLGQGIGNALHHCACQILKKDNLYLYCSHTQTEDGLRLWRQLEKNPKFLMLSDSYWGILTTDRENIIEIQRKCITV